MRVAILGAGNAGTCAALELASRGYGVDLYEESDQPITRASLHNEGKVHLGILYAKDASLNTARLMIKGALSFAPLLKKWSGFESSRVALSTPFYYGVHRGTMVDPDGLKAHYAACKKIFDDAIAAGAEPYLGFEKRMSVTELRRAEWDRLVDPGYFETFFRTTELAVDPREVAELLRGAAQASSRIRFIGRAHVTKVSDLDDGGLEVRFVKDRHEYSERYDQIANTLWHGRLEIDAGIGLRPEFPWSHRYKFANRILVPIAEDTLPSITCVLGPFGDIVNYGSNGLFLSWYPEGMIGTSHDLRPPEWDRELSREQRLAIFQRSLAAWVKRCPLLSSLKFADDRVDPGGGVIFAWGDTGIDDHHSKLHDRYDIGVYSRGNYHSVNTGKFTTAPYMGLKTAERILGIS
jgi:hypothetical protein